jgi:hypothetical protein
MDLAGVMKSKVYSCSCCGFILKGNFSTADTFQRCSSSLILSCACGFCVSLVQICVGCLMTVLSCMVWILLAFIRVKYMYELNLVYSDSSG